MPLRKQDLQVAIGLLVVWLTGAGLLVFFTWVEVVPDDGVHRHRNCCGLPWMAEVSSEEAP